MGVYNGKSAEFPSSVVIGIHTIHTYEHETQTYNQRFSTCVYVYDNSMTTLKYSAPFLSKRTFDVCVLQAYSFSLSCM